MSASLSVAASTLPGVLGNKEEKLMALSDASVSQALRAAEEELLERIPMTTPLTHAQEHGLVLHTRAQIGYGAPPGSDDGPRLRLFTYALSPKWAVQLLGEHARGATDAELETVIARALQEQYFRAPGDRLCIHFGQAQFIDFTFPSR
jgi:hypothetical protein